MTLGVKIITYDKCDFSVDKSVAYNGFFYELPYGNITIPKVFGWCHSSKSFNPVEEGNLEKITEFFKNKLKRLEKRVLCIALIFMVNIAKITNHFDELLKKTGLVTNEFKHLKFKNLFYEKIEHTSFAENFCSLFRNISKDGFLEITEKIFKKLFGKNFQFGIPKDGLPYFLILLKGLLKNIILILDFIAVPIRLRVKLRCTRV